MNLDELIKKRDELREQVAILNLKYVLNFKIFQFKKIH